MQNIVGGQWIVNCYRCDSKTINSLDHLLGIVNNLCAVMQVQILSTGTHEFSPHGISLFVIISASHISIHTWPEYGFLSLDIFSCRPENLSEDTIYKHVVEKIGAEKYDIRKLEHRLNN